jgi:hypothetical protein
MKHRKITVKSDKEAEIIIEALHFYADHGSLDTKDRAVAKRIHERYADDLHESFAHVDLIR